MIWLDTIVQGILLGGLYALFAAGLSLVFGIMRLVNLAHGDLIVMGAYLILTLVTLLGLPPFVAVLIDGAAVLHAVKTPTTEDVTGGIVAALIRLAEDVVGRSDELDDVIPGQQIREEVGAERLWDAVAIEVDGAVGGRHRRGEHTVAVQVDDDTTDAGLAGVEDSVAVDCTPPV